MTGNNDMHLKNFSLYRPKALYQLSPAYDLLNVAIANPKDKEEMALPINGKKAQIKLADFLKASDTMGIEQRVTLGLINGLRNAMPAWIDLINNSFLSDEMKQNYLDLISRRMDVLTKS